MDQETIKQAILREAKRDFFNGVGRILINDFTQEYNISLDEFLDILKSNAYSFRTMGNICLISMKALDITYDRIYCPIVEKEIASVFCKTCDIKCWKRNVGS